MDKNDMPPEITCLCAANIQSARIILLDNIRNQGTTIKTDKNNDITRIHATTILNQIPSNISNYNLETLYTQHVTETLNLNIEKLTTGSRSHVGSIWNNYAHTPEPDDHYTPEWILYKLEKKDENNLRLYLLFNSVDIQNEFTELTSTVISSIDKLLKQHGYSFNIETIITIWNAYIYESQKSTVDDELEQSANKLSENTFIDSNIICFDEDYIASAWERLIYNLYYNGEVFTTERGQNTNRGYINIKINNVHDNQMSDFIPLGNKAMEKYKDEMTEEYADYFISLPEYDKRKFEYCYWKQVCKFSFDEQNVMIDNIKKLETGRQNCIGVLWENYRHIEKTEDQPCWNAFKLEKLNETDICVSLLFRSWDGYGGFPANLPAICYGIEKMFHDYGYQYRISKLIVTGWDCHFYHTDIDPVRKMMTKIEQCPCCKKIHPKHALIQKPKGRFCMKCL